MGVGLGGNKLRKLEYLIGDAFNQGADCIITMGARQSNHARLTAAAAAKAGLKCELVLNRLVPISSAEYLDSGNMVLNRIFGATIFDLPSDADTMDFSLKRVEELKASGFSPYLIPTGGSNATGCLGYVACYQEIIDQSVQSGINYNTIIVPNGSGGTQAGLLAGATISGNNLLPRGYNVLSDPEIAATSTLEKTLDVLKRLNVNASVPMSELTLEHGYRGPAYGIPTLAMKNALNLLARTEGILFIAGRHLPGCLVTLKMGCLKQVIVSCLSRRAGRRVFLLTILISVDKTAQYG